ncbi:hypothetical protein BKA04_000947 [Cryobacterium mesophilum]|uniref:VWA domain-containing protein n=1 Tax=Terrimesophilobacter mesophilus TaxID=433647 RepID=A0A4R8VAF3_9MICO|nr:VWA domain-containing protein [Terrimesophilobacter mesophilus]MBB5632724.1 hypothetical protein [Terrimesophilobacter mesophilus]TFB79525.1 VWA domain-containing protein [Terrimesophilobacter mesophilus]
MTDSNYTALLIILDRSGSMSDIRDDMVGGLEQLIADQAQQPGMLTIDIVTFDELIEHTHAFAQPQDVKVELVPRGSTALYDAVGWSFNTFGKALADLPEHARPGTVLVAIVTDGHENASHEYTADTIKTMITHQREKFGWDITFLGANQDAVLEAQKIGIAPGDALTYAASAAGVSASRAAMSRKMADSRQGVRTEFTQEERGNAAGGASPTP